MQSSSYYLSEMNAIKKDVEKLDKKSAEYSQYVEKLVVLRNNLSSVLEDFTSVGNMLSNGGYSVGGKIIDEDGYKTEKASMSDNVATLDEVINGTNSEIKDFETEINKLEKEYNAAKRNYNNAKNKENNR